MRRVVGRNLSQSQSLFGVQLHVTESIAQASSPHIAADASALFSRNLYNFLSTFWDKEAGKPILDDEIGNAIRLTKDGKVVNERLLG